MKIMASNRGSIGEMLGAFQDRIDELKYGVESCDDVNSCGDIESCGDKGVVLSADDDGYDSSYIFDLEDGVRDALFDMGADSVEFDTESTSLIMYMILNDNVVEFNIPYDDLTGDVQRDIRYILNSVNV